MTAVMVAVVVGPRVSAGLGYGLFVKDGGVFFRVCDLERRDGGPVAIVALPGSMVEGRQAD